MLIGRGRTVSWAAAAILAALAALSGLFQIAPSQHRDVRVGFYENAPKIFTAENGDKAGLFPTILEEVARTEGWNITYTDCVFADCLDLLEQGSIDLMQDVAFTPERAERFDFHSVSVASSWSQVYTRPDLAVRSLQELQGRRVAILKGGVQETFFRDLMQGAGIPYQPVRVSSLDNGYMAVRYGLADAVVTNSFYAARNAGKYNLAETPVMFLPVNLYFAAPHGKNADLLAAIDRRLRDMRGDPHSVYFDAMRRAMVPVPEVVLPAGIQEVLIAGAAVLGLLVLLAVVLRQQVRLRTRQLERALAQLAAERDTLETQVTERTRELASAKDEAERASAIKSEFLANMSHEIRNPLNGVIGLLTLALDGPLEAALRRTLTKAQGAANALLLIINDILDFSKIEAGRLEIEETPFDLEDVLQQVADTVGVLARPKAGGDLRDCAISLGADVPTRLIGDPLRLSQVLINLMGNAMKFTQRGEVELAITAPILTHDRVTLQFRVRDTGIGIAPAAQAKLFQKFTQADQSTTRSFGGTGLGLAICRNLVEMMGGEIALEFSQPGVGTIFSVKIPLPVDQLAQAEHQAAVASWVAGLNGVSALVSDGNELSQRVMQDMLARFGLSLRQDGAVDLALVDIDAGVDGGQGKLITLSTLPDTGGRTAWARASAHLKKPVLPSELALTLLHTLGRAPQVVAAPAPPSLTATNTPSMRVLLVDDSELNRDIGRDMLTRRGYVVETAQNGLDAVTKVAVRHYDVVLMDLQMPVMDGFEATRRIRKMAAMAGNEALADLPILAMTAAVTTQDVDRSLAAGVNEHLSKPLRPIALFEALERWRAKR